MGVLILNIILIIILLFQTTGSFLDNMWIFYALHYSILFAHLFLKIRKKCNYLFIVFSPILMSFIYTGLFFTLGAYVIPKGYGFFLIPYESFPKMNHLNYYTIYLFVTNLVILFFWNLNLNRKSKVIEESLKTQKWIRFKLSNFIFFSTLFLLLSLTKLSFLGSISNTLLYPFKFIVIIALILSSVRLTWRIKLYIYMAILILIALFHYHSKREIILILFAIVFIEFLYNKTKLKLTLKTFGIVSLFTGVIFYMVLVASILRGYGGYKLNNNYEAFFKVPNYIQQDSFVNSVVANFEVNYMFGNTILCMYLVDSDKIPLQYGGSYLKFLLAPIPRSIWKNKPKGIILKYSYAVDPGYEKIGHSMPVVHYAEGFANFYWLGFIIAAFVIVIFEYIFWYIIRVKNKSVFNLKLVFFIYINSMIFQYIRGSGFDLFMLYVVISLPMVLFIKMLQRRNIASTANT